mgnify:FL=1
MQTPSRFTSADSNREVHVRWTPEQPRRRARVVDWNNWTEDGRELVTVRFVDDGTYVRIAAVDASIVGAKGDAMV